ncbi:hypothetical protein F2Q70_00043370 [Brassica cretica]|uniref:Uncharacterized protein n=1 Tax=Brassica cretica TaxID=69181 RepID=A0A3N6QUX6_BRACR|nr:hypothetical protein F2Q70_00043370 [Brassica cretica]KAF3520232.1 hypothetical protein DY000_02060434 [Brassica cretica]
MVAPLAPPACPSSVNRGGIYWIRAPDLPPFDLGGRSEGFMLRHGLAVVWGYMVGSGAGEVRRSPLPMSFSCLRSLPCI